MKVKIALCIIAFVLGIILSLLFSWPLCESDNPNATATYGAEQFHIQLTLSAP